MTIQARSRKRVRKLERVKRHKMESYAQGLPTFHHIAQTKRRGDKLRRDVATVLRHQRNYSKLH